MSKRRYTREILAAAVAQSISVAGVLKLLGCKQAGGTHAHVSRRIREYQLDTSHFLGKRANSGPLHCGGPEKKRADEILVKRERGGRQKPYQLKRALVESGVPYVCRECSSPGEWRGRPLTLQVNHINQDWLDDRKENLEFLCPNCHSQTEGWCRRK